MYSTTSPAAVAPSPSAGGFLAALGAIIVGGFAAVATMIAAIVALAIAAYDAGGALAAAGAITGALAVIATSALVWGSLRWRAWHREHAAMALAVHESSPRMSLQETARTWWPLVALTSGAIFAIGPFKVAKLALRTYSVWLGVQAVLRSRAEAQRH